MCGAAYTASAKNRAGRHGAVLPGYDANREPFLGVMSKHRRHVRSDRRRLRPPTTSWDAGARQLGTRRSPLGREPRLPQRAGHRPRTDWDHRLHDGLRHHPASSPNIALVKYKAPGSVVAPSRSSTRPSPRPLTKLGYSDRRRSPPSWRTLTSTRPSRVRRFLQDEHMAVFDCAFRGAERPPLESPTWATCA